MIDNRVKTIISIAVMAAILMGVFYLFGDNDIAGPSDIQFSESTQDTNKDTNDASEAVMDEPAAPDKTQNTEQQGPEPQEEPKPSNVGEITSCKYWENKTFARIDTPQTGATAAGSLTAGGKLRKITKNGVDFVYLEISPPTTEPQKTFYDFYMGYTGDGKEVNKKEGEKLLFKLGIIEKEKLITSAEVTEKVAKGIATGAEMQIDVELNLTIPFHPEVGTSWQWSFAC